MTARLLCIYLRRLCLRRSEVLVPQRQHIVTGVPFKMPFTGDSFDYITLPSIKVLDFLLQQEKAAKASQFLRDAQLVLVTFILLGGRVAPRVHAFVQTLDDF